MSPTTPALQRTGDQRYDELAAILERHTWVQSFTPDYGHIRVRCTIKPLDDIHTKVRTPAQVRAALFQRAQDAIEAVEQAGWKHAAHPLIEITGAPHPGENGEPILTEGTLELRLTP